MKAITLYQPWAQLIVIGAKLIETRSWDTPYRGTLAIHAGKQTEWIDEMCQRREFKDALLDTEWDAGDAEYKRHNFSPREYRRFPIGAVIAVCELVDCIRIPSYQRMMPVQHGKFFSRLPPDPPESKFGDYRDGRFAWFLENIRALKNPVACRGYQQLWDIPAEFAQQIEAQLENKAYRADSSQPKLIS